MSEPGSRKWYALGAVSLSILAVSLDGTVLSVALPTLAQSLHASATSLEWFSSGYLLMLAAAVLPAGMIGDRYGRKKVLLASLALFGAGSAMCAYAHSPAVFLAARLLMGLAGAGVTVMALSALTVLFTDEERPRAVGVYAAANFLALPLGPTLGGWMLSRFWWGWVFLLNVPVVAIGLLVGMVLVPESRSEQRQPLDPVGIATSTAGLVVVTYGLIGAGEYGWDHLSSLGPIAGGLVVLAVFFGWERRLAAHGGHPLIDPSLFASRTFTWGAVLSGVAGLGMIGLLFIMPQYFQAVQGTDTLGSGLRMLPLVGGMVVGAVPANVLVKAIGAKFAVTLGFVLVAVGSLLGAGTKPDSGLWYVGTWMAVLCAGTGLALTAAMAAALSRLSTDRSGIGSAVVQAFQKTSAPFGTAILGSVLAVAYQGQLHLQAMSATVAKAAKQSVYGGLAVAEQTRSAAFGEQVREAFTHGLRVSLAVSTGLALVGLALTLAFLPRSTGRSEEKSKLSPASAPVQS